MRSPAWPQRGSSSSASSSRTAVAALLESHEVADALSSTAVAVDSIGASSLLTAFSDQGGNINGILFQSSLPAYLLFLYFLNYRGNNTPPLVQFGFSFLLLFVIATIPTGIISKSNFGIILADSDWLHGAAESLLTCTNILLVLGFRGALAGDAALADSNAARIVAGIWLVAVAATLASGIPYFGWEAHTPLLGGIGALSADGFPAEPVNALSLPTWLVHWSSVFEWVIAMSLAWRYAVATGNPKWQGLAWGMLPSHVSSIAALTFHVFYNQVPWILTAQAACTFLGNATLCFAAFRIAASNGWTLSELNPVPAISGAFTRITGGGDNSQSDNAEGKMQESFDVGRLKLVGGGGAELTPGPLLAAEVILLTIAASYITKYGELAFGAGLFQSTDTVASAAAALIVATPPALLVYSMYSGSTDLQQGRWPSLWPDGVMGDIKGLSFEDVKKYGAAGTVAYILTELAFWAVAFPFAAWSLYNTTGHWPDLMTSNDDRVAVAGFVFAGANIVRLVVPLRLAAAIYIVPWVAENITSRFSADGGKGADSEVSDGA